MYYGEKFNSISHLVGAALALIGLGALIAVGIGEGSWRTAVSFSIFGLTLVLLYTMSTLYHSLRSPKLKAIFQKLDHVSIYLLIAGTYTPYLMVSLWSDQGAKLLAGIWSLAVVGFLLDLLIPRRIKSLQIAIYLLMGWLCVLFFSSLRAAIAAPGIVCLAIGGIAYTLGIIFYLCDKKQWLRHAHGIWHLFVLLGSASHFISIIGYVR
ncbi:MAG: hemolysin III family protein [Porticoccaceae bacterium]